MYVHFSTNIPMAVHVNLILTLLLIASSATASYNIVDFGAVADGTTDSAGPLLSAWARACSLFKPASVYVPEGSFFVSKVFFRGPCNNTGVKLVMVGTLVAPSGYGSTNDRWIAFQYVDGLTISGGVLDGRGKALWDCKLAGRSCPTGASSLVISQAKNVLVSGVTSINSELFHMVFFATSAVTVRNVKISAPGNSPNTDGIHVANSDNVTINNTMIGTGDDCISLSQGATNVWIERVNCGPGHGISIGSLGAAPLEAGVENVTVKSVTFTGTQNGLRLKTWATLNVGFVRRVKYQQVVMYNVQNPIIIDQNYCPNNINCPNQTSAVKISDVSYSDVQGTSATLVAVKFDCSATNPCSKIGLQNINLSYGSTSTAKSFCKSVIGSISGLIIPSSCLAYA